MDYMPVYETAKEVIELYKEKIYELQNYAYVNDNGVIGPICKTTFGIK
jgi:hypothetical protein